MWPQQQQQGGLLNPLRNNSALMMSMASGLLGAPSLGEGLSKGFAAAPVGMQADQSRAMQQYKLMQLQNEREREQAEKEQRQQAIDAYAQSQGLDPATAGLYKVDSDLGLKLAPPAEKAKPTSSMREYEMAKEQGFQGSFMDYQTALESAGNANRFGTIPAGMELVTEGGRSFLRPLPGSKQEQEAQAAQKQEGARQRQQTAQSDVVNDDIERAKEKIKNQGMIPSTGMGAMVSGIPGTEAHNLSQILEGVKANIGFDKLQQMRESSPTGGALGQVTEREHRLLQSVYGSIQQSQTEDQLLYNLERFQRLYNETIHGGGQAPAMQGAPTGGAGGGEAQPQTGGTTSSGTQWRLVQ